MKTIRYNTFETNSSSCHSLTITSAKMFEDFKQGYAILDVKTNKVYPLKDFTKLLMERYPDIAEYKYWEYAEGAWEMYSQSTTDSNYGYPTISIEDEDIDSFIEYQDYKVKGWLLDNKGKFYDMIQHFIEDARKYTTYDVFEDVRYPEDMEYSDKVDGVDVVVFGYWSND